jgi:protein-S-isoprenylcysteine O-methyltransferase Ste14
LDERARTLITALVVANIVVIGVVLSVQVFNAAPLTEIDPVSVTMLLVCGLALLGCYAAAGWWALRAERSAPAPAYRS